MTLPPIKSSQLEALAVWFDRLWGTSFNHGAELGLMIPGADNMATGDTLLREMEELGWIKREKFAPTREQKFFGSGGLWYDDLRKAPEHAPRTCFGWSANYASQEAKDFAPLAAGITRRSEST